MLWGLVEIVSEELDRQTAIYILNLIRYVGPRGGLVCARLRARRVKGEVEVVWSTG